MIHSFEIDDFSKNRTELMDGIWLEFFYCHECILLSLSFSDLSVCAFAEIGDYFVFFNELIVCDFDELLLIRVYKGKHLILVKCKKDYIINVDQCSLQVE